ncbi:phosphate acyltransferase [Acidocella aquatica]|uniref:Phosphate acyltransferase n=1 Tax=Acidocella aquatica TaxID=1922313 RepID=A0ABQ6A6U5_9PROT|nr:phosphate acyltransferase PlsX [Acidocella aquatica]GLR65810.1 phosphate acyltransferase [Acidocella aquatica]
MSRSNILAVDAMGGDHAPEAIIAGLEIASVRHPLARFLLFGDEAVLAPLVAKTRRLKAQSTLHHAGAIVTGDMKPTVALRMRDSSMRRAIDAVHHNEAAGVISAGNTGALLALSKIVLKTMQGIDRPAMAATAPSAKGDVVMLDLGLNVVCDSRNLVEFALMGEMFAKIVLGLPAPTIGLLNVGSEEGKGNDILRAAAATLRESPIGAQFHGFIEGHDITAGTVNVIVTDGFTGNVALKTGEGAFKLVGDLLKRVFTSGPLAKAGYMLARGALRRLRELLDPRRYNGAVLLGLNGVVVKSHGGTDAEGFAHAVDVAMDMITNDFNSRIAEGLAAMDSAILATEQAGSPDV